MTHATALSEGRAAFGRARRRCVRAWIALLLLLAASAASAHFHLGLGNLVAGVGIALVKAAIVGWIFMELDGATGLARTVAGVGVGALMLLGGLSMVDFAPRHDEPTPYQPPAAVAPLLMQRH
jgi:caa(3)-type oxidase subunit IV